MLYNQYRPVDYSEVCGQEDSLITLRKQAAMGKFGHAYLLGGPRGTGKTSIGRILSKAVNCLNPTEKGPCNKCVNCIAAKNSLDIFELDAASNNGVDKIKELVSKTKYKPVSLPKKVYLIDEVHNLSPGAFDALLKTIEEPPSYCVFILCTTEWHKIPVTIISRCEQYHFNKIEPATMKQRLKYVLKDQNAECEEGALNLIVRRADGALRDALSILEQLLVCTEGRITTEATKKNLGIMGEELVIEVLGHILEHRTIEALKIYDELLINGKAPGILADIFLEVLTDLITLISTQSPESIFHSQEYVSALISMMERTNLERLFWLTEQFCSLRAVIRGSVTPSMDIRLCVIKTSNKELIMSDPASMASELAAQRTEISQLRILVEQLRTRTYVEEKRIAEHDSNKETVEPELEESEPVTEKWNNIEDEIVEPDETQNFPFGSSVPPTVLPDPIPSKVEAKTSKGVKEEAEESREKMSRQKGGMQSGERRDAKAGKEGVGLTIKDIFRMLS